MRSSNKSQVIRCSCLFVCEGRNSRCGEEQPTMRFEALPFLSCGDPFQRARVSVHAFYLLDPKGIVTDIPRPWRCFPMTLSIQRVRVNQGRGLHGSIDGIERTATLFCPPTHIAHAYRNESDSFRVHAWIAGITSHWPTLSSSPKVVHALDCLLPFLGYSTFMKSTNAAEDGILHSSVRSFDVFHGILGGSISTCPGDVLRSSTVFVDRPCVSLVVGFYPPLAEEGWVDGTDGVCVGSHGRSCCVGW